MGASGMCKSTSEANQFDEQSLLRRFKIKKKRYEFSCIKTAAFARGFEVVDCAGSANIMEDGSIVEIKETFKFVSDDHMNCIVELHKPNGHVDKMKATFVPIRNQFKGNKYSDGTYSRIVITPTKIVGKAVI